MFNDIYTAGANFAQISIVRYTLHVMLHTLFNYLSLLRSLVRLQASFRVSSCALKANQSMKVFCWRARGEKVTECSGASVSDTCVRKINARPRNTIKNTANEVLAPNGQHATFSTKLCVLAEGLRAQNGNKPLNTSFQNKRLFYKLWYC